jgi:hypothetical protein
MTLESHPPTSRDSVYLGDLLRLFASRVSEFQKLLAKPKSVPSSILTTFGLIEPLGFERFRICELYAELLHCSNFALLNDPRGEEIVRERDIERARVRNERRSTPQHVDDANVGQGRQSVRETNSSDGTKEGNSNGEVETLGSTDVRRAPKSAIVENVPIIGLDSLVTGGVSHQAATQKTEDSDQTHYGPKVPGTTEPNRNPSVVESSPEVPYEFDDNARVPKDIPNGKNNTVDRDSERTPAPSLTSLVGERLVVGDYLKLKFVEASVLPSVLDLFFAHPWNNFLHNVVYDILTQAMHGPIDKGVNRRLVVDLFTTGQLVEKILQAQKVNDESQ